MANYPWFAVATTGDPQAALDSNCGMVYFPAGTYSQSVPLQPGHSGQRIIGSLRKRGGQATISNTSGGPCFLIPSGMNDISFEDFATGSGGYFCEMQGGEGYSFNAISPVGGCLKASGVVRRVIARSVFSFGSPPGTYFDFGSHDHEQVVLICCFGNRNPDSGSDIEFALRGRAHVNLGGAVDAQDSSAVYGILIDQGVGIVFQGFDQEGNALAGNIRAINNSLVGMVGVLMSTTSNVSGTPPLIKAESSSRIGVTGWRAHGFGTGEPYELIETITGGRVSIRHNDRSWKGDYASKITGTVDEVFNGAFR